MIVSLFLGNMRRAVTSGVLGSVAFLYACGGGGGGGTGTTTHVIGGSLTGLLGTVVVQNNGADNLTLSANGAFSFATPMAQGAAYAVTVLTQPAGQNCAVANASGTASAAVTNVSITCTAVQHVIGGSVTGLLGTVVVQNNGADNISLSADGAFSFATAIAQGGAYTVTVLAQPTGQTCVVANASGTSNAAVTNVSITCTSLGALALFAGDMRGPGNVDGIGAAARFSSPSSVAADSAGNVYVSDTFHHTVRKIAGSRVWRPAARERAQVFFDAQVAEHLTHFGDECQTEVCDAVRGCPDDARAVELANARGCRSTSSRSWWDLMRRAICSTGRWATSSANSTRRCSFA